MKKMLAVFAVVLSIAIISFGLIGCSKKKTEMPAEMQTAEMAAQPATPVQLNSESLSSQAAAKIAGPVSQQTGAMPSDVSVAPIGKPSNEEIQTALKNAGFYMGTVDGKLGPKTKKAIENFQKDNGLVVDGKVGAKTWSKLQAHLNAAPMQKSGD